MIPKLRSAVGKFSKSCRYALAGVMYLFRTQVNARIELTVAAVVCVLGVFLYLSAIQWALLVGMMALVLALEGVNTAIELTVDLASPSFHPYARRAKDVAAGVVLLASAASVIVGVLVLGSALWERIVNR